MKLNLDDWQTEFIATKGDKILCTGRQVGKSVVCSIDAGQWALTHSDKTLLIIAPTERQAYALFEKTLAYIQEVAPSRVDKSPKLKPTKSRLVLKNKTRIYCLPVGLSGLGIRFLTISRLYADEASRIPDSVWNAITPMMLMTGGDKIYLSTPAGRSGEFYRVWNNQGGNYDSFTRFSISSEETILKRRISETWTQQQQEKALTYLKQERARMSKLEYAQEYEGQFLEELSQYFPSELIRSCMKLTPGLLLGVGVGGSRSLGADVARLGGDESALIGLEQEEGSNKLRQITQDAEQNTRLTAFARKIEEWGLRDNYDRIYVDDGGLGAGVVDILLESGCRRRVRAINNATWVYSNDKKQKRLMKEHLYNNLLRLMENGEIELFKDASLFQSLNCIQAEYLNGKVHIFGRYSHLAEALVRAAWITKEKGLKLWVC